MQRNKFPNEPVIKDLTPVHDPDAETTSPGNGSNHTPRIPGLTLVNARHGSGESSTARVEGGEEASGGENVVTPPDHTVGQLLHDIQHANTDELGGLAGEMLRGVSSSTDGLVTAESSEGSEGSEEEASVSTYFSGPASFHADDPVVQSQEEEDEGTDMDISDEDSDVEIITELDATSSPTLFQHLPTPRLQPPPPPASMAAAPSVIMRSNLGQRPLAATQAWQARFHGLNFGTATPSQSASTPMTCDDQPMNTPHIPAAEAEKEDPSTEKMKKLKETPWDTKAHAINAKLHARIAALKATSQLAGQGPASGATVKDSETDKTAEAKRTAEVEKTIEADKTAQVKKTDQAEGFKAPTLILRPTTGTATSGFSIPGHAATHTAPGFNGAPSTATAEARNTASSETIREDNAAESNKKESGKQIVVQKGAEQKNAGKQVAVKKTPTTPSIPPPSCQNCIVKDSEITFLRSSITDASQAANTAVQDRHAREEEIVEMRNRLATAAQDVETQRQRHRQALDQLEAERAANRQTLDGAEQAARKIEELHREAEAMQTVLVTLGRHNEELRGQIRDIRGAGPRRPETPVREEDRAPFPAIESRNLLNLDSEIEGDDTPARGTQIRGRGSSAMPRGGSGVSRGSPDLFRGGMNSNRGAFISRRGRDLSRPHQDSLPLEDRITRAGNKSNRGRGRKASRSPEGSNSRAKFHRDDRGRGGGRGPRGGGFGKGVGRATL